jgi:hypothetical protein
MVPNLSQRSSIYEHTIEGSSWTFHDQGSPPTILAELSESYARGLGELEALSPKFDFSPIMTFFNATRVNHRVACFSFLYAM